MTHIIYIPFTGVGLYGGYRGDGWFNDRIDIFKSYTLKSLRSQTNKNFILWCSFRPQEENNPLTLELKRSIQEEGLNVAFTFQGLMYHDDKFGGSFIHRMKNIGRVVRGCYRNKTWKDVFPNCMEVLKDKNTDLVTRLARALPLLTPHVHGDVLLTRIDSDDMFRKDAVDQIQKAMGEAITIPQGYIHNSLTGEVAEYNPTTNPPFHTLTFLLGTFLDPQMHFNRYKGYESHEDVDDRFWRTPLKDRLFCVVTHSPSAHISTGFNHPFRGKMVDKGILKEFGL